MNGKKGSGKFDVAVVGASGMVGGELLGLLESRRFPVAELYAFNSGRRAAYVRFRGRRYACSAPSFGALKRADIVFFVSNEEVSEKFAPRLAAEGVWCVDDSSQFRLSPKVPLVIPEVNGGELKSSRRLIAGPNCTLTGAAVALAGVHRRYGLSELRMATYQAVSGAGKAAMTELEEELRGYLRKGSVPRLKGKGFPRPIAFNLFPQVGGFDAEGNTGEENKVEAELKKILGAPRLRISVTSVRVPVLRGHSLALWFTTSRPCGLADIRREFARTPGLKFLPEPENYPTPLENGHRTDIVYAGRLRRSKTSPREFQLWVVSDNLYKGAALNSVQIAEHLIDL
ncbi:MAG: aspartate-semialdehyde dehydrogenase [Elusimicrobia bacterium]|nr:aspartate-semialdehyde dehydrogenase [Elusimicrobiota bacterium]